MSVSENRIKISNPKIILINHINTPPNPTSTTMLTIADSGENIHLARQATPTMAPVIIDLSATSEDRKSVACRW